MKPLTAKEKNIVRERHCFLLRNLENVSKAKIYFKLLTDINLTVVLLFQVKPRCILLLYSRTNIILVTR